MLELPPESIPVKSSWLEKCPKWGDMYPLPTWNKQHCQTSP